MIPRRFAVVGDPVAHSRSPAMHAAAYRALGLPHTYEALRATPSELPRVVDALRSGAFDGLNVTVPHKERVLALVDEIDATAQTIGAANTLVRSPDGHVIGHNTDAPALAAELRRLGGSPAVWAQGRALVLGSGGAARAAVAAFARLGVLDIVVRARAFEDAFRRDRFVGEAPAPITPQPWRASESSECATIAVVQATSAGIAGADPGDAVADAVAWGALPESAVAIDVVYAPRDTPFLRAARSRGLRCDDGLGMLARQGALAFELWLDLTAPQEIMRAAIE
ncbi:MAG TPA: shikimate dehydrogenase [Polyangiaceae bacterium]|nr:shikimate dehydrogenase [Polyangiaceae bacterium]